MCRCRAARTETWGALSRQLSGGMDIFAVDSEIRGVPDWPMNIGPRVSIAYDLFGDGRAALKGGWGRYYTQIGTRLSDAANPNGSSGAWVGWNDVDGDKLVDVGPSGTLLDSPELDLSRFEGFTGGASTVYDRNANRPYSDDASIGLDMTLGRDVSFSATFHRRLHRDALGERNEARPPSAYDQVTMEAPAGSPQSSYPVYVLKEEYRGLQQTVITTVDILRSTYNGAAFQLQKRFSNRWQMLGGLTVSSHKGTVHDTPYTRRADWNNPNTHTNRLDGSVFSDIPWVVNFAGSYLFPRDIQLAWNYRARAGDPIVPSVRYRGLVQGTQTIYAEERGDEPDRVGDQAPRPEPREDLRSRRVPHGTQRGRRQPAQQPAGSSRQLHPGIPVPFGDPPPEPPRRAVVGKADVLIIRLPAGRRSSARRLGRRHNRTASPESGNARFGPALEFPSVNSLW